MIALTKCCRILSTTCLSIFLLSGAVARAQKLDTQTCMWHVRMVSVWEGKARRGTRDIDIYLIVDGGKWASGLATARGFNKSVHFVDTTEFAIDGKKISGKGTITLTPDAWVPRDHQPIECPVEWEGELSGKGELKKQLQGTYRVVFEGEERKGKLYGGIEPIKTGFENRVWGVSLNQCIGAEDPRAEEIRVKLGVLGDKVVWANVGPWMRAGLGYGGYISIPWDPTGSKVTPYVVSAKGTVPHRAISPPADPEEVCGIEVEIVRVQGLAGGRAKFTVTKDGKPVKTWLAFGRGELGQGRTGKTNYSKKKLWNNKADLDPWWVPVKGFKAPEPGEHPRLFFRKSDIPELRKRAETEEGKAIVKRLRRLLAGNGERVPTKFNPTPPANHNKSPNLPLGETFTTWHAMGYGFLYVLTGDKKYAELSKKCVELAFDGKIDRDNRYGWSHPGTEFRAGSAVTGIATAYDFCYDAWPKKFRDKVAREIQDYNKPCSDDGTKFVDIKKLAGRTGYPPSSNHYGAHMGIGSAILAILGDPGAEKTDELKLRLKELEDNIPRILSHGFGDHGFYAEGHHPGRISSNCGLSEFLMALKSAAGRDYITPRPNAQWMALQWVMLLMNRGKPMFPHRGKYGGDDFDGGGMSHSGDVAFGFGIVEEKYRPALLWVYENFVKPHRFTYGANTYPHRAVHALLHWPIGRKAQNPEGIVPLAEVDRIHGFFMNRNRWKDRKDILITTYAAWGPVGYHRIQPSRRMVIWGLGVQLELRAGGISQPSVYKPAEDGSVIVGSGGGHFAIDFSEASGAPAMVVAIGGELGKTDHKGIKEGNVTTKVTKLTAGGTKFMIFTLQEGGAPTAKVKGDKIEIGKQTVSFNGEHIVLAEFD